MSQQRQGSASELQAGISNEGLPRTILAELKRLPSARAFPPFLGFKRGRPDGAAGTGGLLGRSSSKPLGLDPTGVLLVEAASQLRELVEQQACRRMLRAPLADGGAARAGGGGEDSCSEAGEDDHEQDGPALSASLDTADSASGPSGPSSLGSLSYGGEPVQLPCGRSCHTGGSRRSGHSSKRACLERQYALDLDGYCRAIGERLPLPEALEAAE